MSARGRSELLLAGWYLMLAPAIVLLAALLQTALEEGVWYPGFPGWLEPPLLLLVPALTGLVLYAAARLAAGLVLRDAGAARALPRLAPLVIGAAGLTLFWIWAALLSGDRKAEEILTWPALTLGGGLLGESLMHARLSQRGGGGLLVRLGLGGAVAVGAVAALAAWRRPARADPSAEICAWDYADARTAADSLAVDGKALWAQSDRPGVRRCADLRAAPERVRP